MKTLVKQGWGADNPAFRQIFTSLMMPAATKDQMDAFNELQRLSGSPDGAVRYMETTGDLDVRELLSQVKAPTLVMHVRDDPMVPNDSAANSPREYPVRVLSRCRARTMCCWSRTPACRFSSKN